jgi:hypothetical protein
VDAANRKGKESENEIGKEGMRESGKQGRKEEKTTKRRTMGEEGEGDLGKGKWRK